MRCAFPPYGSCDCAGVSIWRNALRFSSLRFMHCADRRAEKRQRIPPFLIIRRIPFRPVRSSNPSGISRAPRTCETTNTANRARAQQARVCTDLSAHSRYAKRSRRHRESCIPKNVFARFRGHRSVCVPCPDIQSWVYPFEYADLIFFHRVEYSLSPSGSVQTQCM